MPLTRLVDASVFQPEELTLLQDMFDQLCSLRGITRQSPEAATAAEALLSRYKAGLRGDELIRSLQLK